MAMNPMQLMQMAERLRIFKEQHPRVLDFLHARRMWRRSRSSRTSKGNPEKAFGGCRSKIFLGAAVF